MENRFAAAVDNRRLYDRRVVEAYIVVTADHRESSDAPSVSVASDNRELSSGYGVPRRSITGFAFKSSNRHNKN